MSSDLALEVRDLGKCYHIYEAPRDRLKQMIVPRLQRLAGRPPGIYHREFWALRDLSFDLPRGQTLGVVGRNGSGKSTLLQMISGTLNPTSGSIQARGRIAALLELGSGFNPEFTGRENVFLNGAVLGLSTSEIEARFDAICAFADIGDHLDQPVKTYSSGMVVRLAFAVSASVDPDILVVDEALAVGDSKFQAKCFERLRRLKDRGTSILLVTHSSDQVVTHCSQAILLDAGRMVEAGAPRTIINRYMDLLFGKERKPLPAAAAPDAAAVAAPPAPKEAEDDLDLAQDRFAARPNYNRHEYRWGDGAATLLDFHLARGADAFPAGFHTGDVVRLAVAVRFNEDIVRPILGLTLKTKEGVSLYGVNSETLDCQEIGAMGGAGTVMRATMRFRCPLAPGDYFISLGLASKHGEEVIPHDRRYDSIHLHVMPNTRFFGLCDLELDMALEHAAVGVPA